MIENIQHIIETLKTSYSVSINPDYFTKEQREYLEIVYGMKILYHNGNSTTFRLPEAPISGSITIYSDSFRIIDDDTPLNPGAIKYEPQ